MVCGKCGGVVDVSGEGRGDDERGGMGMVDERGDVVCVVCVVLKLRCVGVVK